MGERAYMVHDGEPMEAAVVVFASHVSEAKKLAWKVLKDWGGEWTDMRVRWLRGDCEHLRAKPGPHVNESPPSCRDCDRWHVEPLTVGRCNECHDEWLALERSEPEP